ncbi:MAG: NAD(P)/FAD-dependent oxidoreductase [Planctomycetota bacterium]|nr:NAD(P)/FAD-dependent oxidoreductase [Planctomycetota bacterium]
MSTSNQAWDVIVIGGGAAGLMAAYSAAERGRQVLLLEKNRKLGVKILMSGGTRCNITHDCGPKEIATAIGEKGRFLYPALGALPPHQIVQMIESCGVSTKIESTGKIFPASDRAIDVRDALVSLAESAGAIIRNLHPVTDVSRDNEEFLIKTEAASFRTRRLILTTGGKSYPGCGTTGDGYTWATALGHTLVPPVAALTPIQTSDPGPRQLSGMTLPLTGVTVMDTSGSQSQVIAQDKGSVLFTHFGFSGPAILNVSRVINCHKPSGQLLLQLDFVCRGTTEQFSSQLRQLLQAQGKSSIANLAIEEIPRRLMRFLLDRANILPETRAAELSREQANRLTGELKSASFPISGTLGFEKAEVTAGGINLQEIHSKTMESKVCPGLFLAGEVIDIDGPIGGYNFQAAFSTGWLAGLNA